MTPSQSVTVRDCERAQTSWFVTRAELLGGEVWQDERTFRPPHRRPVGVVFQEAGLLPHLSVRRNLLYGARRTSANPTAGLQDTIDSYGTIIAASDPAITSVPVNAPTATNNLSLTLENGTSSVLHS